jgi:hypothetical protein
MANIKFVGFQDSFEIPESHERLELHHEISCALDKDSAFSLISIPAEISKWFFEIKSLDPRAGGKVSFINSQGINTEAVCTSMVLGKEVSLVSREFGEVKARVEGKKSDISIVLDFKLFTDNSAATTILFEGFVSRLRELVS